MSDEGYDRIISRIRRLLAQMPSTETAVFQDEVDINLNPKIGRLHLSEACRRRNSEFFIQHLEGVSHRFFIHFLPAYAPESSPNERVWWHMHEVVTRNHQCDSIDDAR